MNIDYLQLAVNIVHATNDDDRTANAIALLNVFDPHEPYDDNYPRDPNACIVVVCLNAYIIDPHVVTRRALVAACENYYEMS